MAQPEWNSWFTAPQRVVFLESLQSVFDARGLQASISGDVVVIDTISVDLFPLAERCAQVEVAHYPEVIEANIDDMTPEIAGYLLDCLFSVGALDAWITPIQMKKNRHLVELR